MGSGRTREEEAEVFGGKVPFIFVCGEAFSIVTFPCFPLEMNQRRSLTNLCIAVIAQLFL